MTRTSPAPIARDPLGSSSSGEFRGRDEEPRAQALSEPDPELLALPAPPRRGRTATLAVMSLTAAAALAMCAALAAEAAYAISPGRPLEVADLAALAPGEELANRYVRGHGLLGASGAVRYGRPAEGDSFRLAPIAGNPRVWVEIRVPEGFEGPRFVPPSTFAGRLVPLGAAGIRHVGLRNAVAEHPGGAVPEDAWLLVDGNSPRASRWALALVVLLLGFAGWNLAGIMRIVRKIRDGARPVSP